MTAFPMMEVWYLTVLTTACLTTLNIHPVRVQQNIIDIYTSSLQIVAGSGHVYILSLYVLLNVQIVSSTQTVRANGPFLLMSLTSTQMVLFVPGPVTLTANKILMT